MKLKRFDPEWMTPEATCLFLGPRKAGKSCAMRHCLYAKRKSFPNAGIVFSESEMANGDWGKIVHPLLVLDEWVPEKAEKMWKEQEIKSLDILTNGFDPETTPLPNVFIVAEDVADDSTFKNCKTLKKIYFKGRHYYIFFMVTIWNATILDNKLRKNTQYAFIFNTPNEEERKRIYREFCSSFVPTFDLFNQIMNKFCVDYACLVIDNTVTSNNIEERLFIFKADNSLDFSLISDEQRAELDKYTKSNKDRLKEMILARNSSIATTPHSVKDIDKARKLREMKKASKDRKKLLKNIVLELE